MLRQTKNARICLDKKKKATQLKQMIQLKEINQKVLTKEGRLKGFQDRIK